MSENTENPENPETPEQPELPPELILPEPETFESMGCIEQQTLNNSGVTFYGNVFGTVSFADNGNYSQNQDVGQNSVAPPESNPTFILRERAEYVPIQGTFDSNVLSGTWEYISVNYQELDNVVSESAGFDRNMILKNQFTKLNAWSE